MKKKLFLFFLVSLEISAGAVFLWSYLKYKENNNQVLGTNMVAKIDQTKVIKNIDKELKFYWEYKPNESFSDSPSWLKSTAHYNINNDGLNDLQNYEIEKPNKTYRIIALGDSFTFGHYINTADNWTEILERKLNNQSSKKCNLDKIEVLNLGMPGFDVEGIVKRYQRVGQKYQPDLVIFFESGTGFSRMNEIEQPILKDCYSKSTTSSSQTIYQMHENCSNQASAYVLNNFSESERFKKLELSLNDLLSIIKQDQLAIIYNDEGQNYKNSYLNDWQKKYPQVSFHFPTLSLDEKVAHLADGHPNQIGHERIAKSVFDFIATDKLTCLNN